MNAIYNLVVHNVYLAVFFPPIPVSHRYGYGLMDAEALVKEAERWTVIPEQNICSSKYILLDQ